jgi:hypothetical protein
LLRIRDGAFQASLNLARPILKNQIVKACLIVSFMGAVALLLPGSDAFDFFVIAQALVAVCIVLGCCRVVKRSNGKMPLPRLYSVRLAVGITVYSLLVSILLVLTDFLASFDARFRLPATAVWGGVALCLLFACLIFFYAALPRAKDLARRIADLATARGALTVTELDEMYVPGDRRPAPMSTALTSAGAIFGATTLAKSSWFAGATFFVDFLVATLFLRACISLVYEKHLVLSSSELVRALIVLDAVPTA